MYILLALAWLLLLPLPLAAQTASAPDAYRDEVARRLVARAREAREEQGRSVTSYTAVVRARSAAVLRTPLKDRLLAREESASRVRWSRDGETVVQVLASREQEPGQVEAGSGSDAGHIFDPSSDRIYFGMGMSGSNRDSDGFWIAHPLAAGAEEHYRYRSGDTLALRLPGGRTIRAVELHVIPRRESFHFLSATLWVEPESGALVQAVYRPSRSLDAERDTAIFDEDDLDVLGKLPAMFKPIEANLALVVVQYSLWNLEHWLPRLMRVEGYARAGVLRIPFSGELSYQIEDVQDETTSTAPPPPPEEVIARWSPDVRLVGHSRGSDGRRVRVYRPEDRSTLLSSPELPPPIWKDAPAFASDAELEALLDRLEEATPRAAMRAPVELELRAATVGAELVRYNRVEGLSVGARAVARHPLGEAHVTARVGAADLHPNAELGLSLPAWGRTLSVETYHHLATVDAGHSLGLGNSLAALVLGRDDGEYYRASGARLTLAPAPHARPWYRWSAFAERQRPVERGTDWSLAHLLGRDGFRPNLAADPTGLVGAGLSLSPWWGRDPLAPQLGLVLATEAATGDHTFARAALTARAALPLSAGLRAGLEAAGGTSWGEPPLQYHWFVGGPRTLRGYDGSAAVGPSFARARAELARGTAVGALALFADAGWAGARSAFDPDQVLLSAGVGASILDGLIRIDLARALRHPTGWRLDLYLDALL